MIRIIVNLIMGLFAIAISWGAVWFLWFVFVLAMDIRDARRRRREARIVRDATGRDL